MDARTHDRVVAVIQENAASMLRIAKRNSLCADDARDAYQRTLDLLAMSYEMESVVAETRAGPADPARVGSVDPFRCGKGRGNADPAGARSSAKWLGVPAELLAARGKPRWFPVESPSATYRRRRGRGAR